MENPIKTSSCTDQREEIKRGIEVSVKMLQNFHRKGFEPGMTLKCHSITDLVCVNETNRLL